MCLAFSEDVGASDCLSVNQGFICVPFRNKNDLVSEYPVRAQRTRLGSPVQLSVVCRTFLSHDDLGMSLGDLVAEDLSSSID